MARRAGGHHAAYEKRGRSARRRIGTLVGGGLLLVAPPLSAQQEAALAEQAEAALEACAFAAQEGREKAAKEAADRADSLFLQLDEADDRVVGMTGRARILTQCRIPFANFMRKGALLEESNELLRAALRIDPSAVVTRFTLGMNHYHSPAFLGRTEDALAR
jgi:hypothetical protein